MNKNRKNYKPLDIEKLMSVELTPTYDLMWDIDQHDRNHVYIYRSKRPDNLHWFVVKGMMNLAFPSYKDMLDFCESRDIFQITDRGEGKISTRNK